jgi:hypothetical protein
MEKIIPVRLFEMNKFALFFFFSLLCISASFDFENESLVGYINKANEEKQVQGDDLIK